MLWLVSLCEMLQEDSKTCSMWNIGAKCILVMDNGNLMVSVGVGTAGYWDSSSETPSTLGTTCPPHVSSTVAVF